MEHQSISNFDGETAVAFLEEMSINGFGMIQIAIEKMTDEDERPSLSDCEEALIACEIVAAINGNPSDDFPDDLQEWMGMFLPNGSEEQESVIQLSEKAADVIDAILTDSELRDLWEESTLFEEWMQYQVQLQERILS